MKKNLLAILVFSVAVLMSSCGFEDGAIYVNDTLVDKAEKVEVLMSEVYDYIDEDEYDSALAYLDSVTNHVKDSEIAIAKLKNKSAEEFKQSVLEYLAMYSATVADYRQAIEWYQSEDDELFEKANDIINNFDVITDEKLSEIIALQKEFAENNNLELDYDYNK